MELSTKILINESKKRNLIVSIIDEENNFISISNDKKTEYIQQATKTSLDNYASVLIMENKYVTKYVLENNNINVAKGIKIAHKYDIDNIYKYFNKNTVIKPLSTNFGIGITLLKGSFSKEDLQIAISEALSKDTSIIIEEMLFGEEYRFILVDHEVIGILKREPANVIGDGINTIEKLIKLKNQHPYRGYNYEKPLQKIELGDVELNNLKQLGLSKDSIIEKDKIIYLRKNSNISTGGDSIDLTDKVIDYYKEIASKASKALNVSITGLDFMIEDIYKEGNYGIIEANFNPAIHIHHYPSHGKERNVASKILDCLFK